jgi:hypothetical protein
MGVIKGLRHSTYCVIAFVNNVFDKHNKYYNASLSCINKHVKNDKGIKYTPELNQCTFTLFN